MIIFSIIFTLTIGLFIGLTITNNIDIYKTSVKIIVTAIIAICIGFGLTKLLELEIDRDRNEYNNGICHICNSKFELFDIEHSRYGGGTYYYKCENGHVISTNVFFN